MKRFYILECLFLFFFNALVLLAFVHLVLCYVCPYDFRSPGMGVPSDVSATIDPIPLIKTFQVTEYCCNDCHYVVCSKKE